MRRIVTAVAICVGVLSAPVAANAVVKINVDLTNQTMHVVDGSGQSYDWLISSGRSGHLTPRGRFSPRALYAMVHSAKYNNAPMPHSIFFYGQYAIHGTTAVGMLGHPASHGCVRLHPANAATLFAMVRGEGASIAIGGNTPATGGDYIAKRKVNRPALAYAPRTRERSFREWLVNPTGR